MRMRNGMCLHTEVHQPQDSLPETRLAFLLLCRKAAASEGDMPERDGMPSASDRGSPPDTFASGAPASPAR